MLEIIKESFFLLDQHKASDIAIYDVEKVASYASYVIIANGSSITHLKTLADKLNILYKKHHIPPYTQKKSAEKNPWMLLDYGDIIIHLTLEKTREYYKLDKLFADAKTIRFEERTLAD